MSYEGYSQCLCLRGHLFNRDAYEDDGVCDCGAETVWRNQVDETNGEAMGFIPPTEFVKLRLTDNVITTCSHCGVSKLEAPATYRIPTEDEARFMRHYRPDYGAGLLRRIHDAPSGTFIKDE